MSKTRWKIRLEFKWQDLWVGLFVKTNNGHGDVWLCLLPCLPIHLSWWPVSPAPAPHAPDKPVPVVAPKWCGKQSSMGWHICELLRGHEGIHICDCGYTF